MRKHTFENIASKSVGVITNTKVHRNGFVKYKILYRDMNDREHTSWSDWMRFDGYQIGDSIPVKYIVLPPTLGICNGLLEVNNHPQNQIQSMIAPVAIASIASLGVGYFIGKCLSKNKRSSG
jgi:hypothetical protein